jgi:hypothetical protein
MALTIDDNRGYRAVYRSNCQVPAAKIDVAVTDTRENAFGKQDIVTVTRSVDSRLDIGMVSCSIGIDVPASVHGWKDIVAVITGKANTLCDSTHRIVRTGLIKTTFDRPPPLHVPEERILPVDGVDPALLT